MSVTNRLISVLSILSCLGVSYADTLIVPDQYGTIQSAIDAAQEGDEVVIQPGIYNETFNLNAKAITIRSAEGPFKTRLDFTGVSPNDDAIDVFDTPVGARIEGLTIVRLAQGIYKAIEVNTDANLELVDCRIVGCKYGVNVAAGASLTAQGLYFVGGERSVQLTSASGATTAEFTDCAWSGILDPFEICDGAAVSLTDCVVDSCSTRRESSTSMNNGVVSLDESGSSFVATNSQFTNCSTVNAGYNGCVIVCRSGTTAEFSGCTFSGNTGQGSVYGSTLHSDGASVLIHNGCLFDREGATESREGIVYAGSGDFVIKDSVFTQCGGWNSPGVASSYRMFVAQSGTDLTLENVRFDGNLYASTILDIDNPQSVSLIGCEFANTGTPYVNTFGTYTTVEMDLASFSSIEIRDCVWSDNNTRRCVTASGQPTQFMISNCVFAGNQTDEVNGTCVQLSDAEAVIDGCAFIGNTNDADGDGIWDFGRSIRTGSSTSFPPYLSNNLFCGSQQEQLSGGMILKSGNVFDENCDQDCDGDGLPDGYEIANGLEADCNGNELPDSCEAGGDCDGDGILDECAIANGAPDCDGNGVPDDCQADCDGDGTLDVCEITAGATDCNADGVPDDCQLALGLLDDFNNDGTPDVCQTLDFTGLETEIVLIEDRILDSAIPSTAVCYRLYATFDPDSVGAAQLLGVYGSKKSPLMIAAAGGFWQDTIGGNTSAGVLCDDALAFPDLRYDSWLTIEAFCANDNLLVEAGIDWSEFNAGGSLSIGDGGVFLYPDDAQGIPGLDGRILIGQVTSTDGSLPTGAVNLIGQNADGSDWQAFGISWPEPPLVDCNGNGIHDAYDLSDGTSRDCDGSGVPDECEYDFSNDCNENGIDDLCDVADGTSGDADGDFVPDECECSGDATRDGIVNVDDIIAVILAWGSNDPDADIDGNGIVDATDLVLVLGGYGACL